MISCFRGWERLMPPLLKYTTCECTVKSLSKILMLNCFMLMDS